MDKELVKNEILKELNAALKNTIFKGIIKRCTVLILIIDFESRKVSFEFKKNDFTIYKKAFVLDSKYKGSNCSIYEFSKDEILNCI